VRKKLTEEVLTEARRAKRFSRSLPRSRRCAKVIRGEERDYVFVLFGAVTFFEWIAQSVKYKLIKF
jgi:hypothetical protein